MPACEQVETIVVGGGQAGLAMSYWLRQFGHEHVVLERYRVAERWRSERWDSLAFQSPKWNMRLPGYASQAADLKSFASRSEVVEFIEEYAAFAGVPLRCGTEAKVLRQKPGSAAFVIETQDGSIEARNVVIATGPYQLPAIPLNVSTTALQIHSSQYRCPELLPPGAVLVIGSGNSGCQIAEEICSAGRQAYLSVSPHRRTPRRYRGRDYIWWHIALGEADTTVEQRRGPQPSRLITGVDGGYDIDLRAMAANGVQLLGRLMGGGRNKLTIAADLRENLVRGDAAYAAFVQAADLHASREQLDLSPSVGQESAALEFKDLSDPILTLDLAERGVSTIIWATGFRYDFEWIDLPLFSNYEARAPVHKRGVSQVPGIYFIGLPWLHKFKSSFLHGVGEDAQYLAEHITGVRGEVQVQ